MPPAISWRGHKKKSLMSGISLIAGIEILNDILIITLRLNNTFFIKHPVSIIGLLV
jgi:hypothetical protein